MGTILVKSALNALRIEVLKKKIIEEIQFSGTIFVIDIFLKTSIFKAFKALFTKIVPNFCQLILKFC